MLPLNNRTPGTNNVLSTKTRESIDLKSQDIEFGIMNTQDFQYYQNEQDILIQKISLEMQKMGLNDPHLISEILSSEAQAGRGINGSGLSNQNGNLDEDPVFNQDLKALKSTIQNLERQIDMKMAKIEKLKVRIAPKPIQNVNL